MPEPGISMKKNTHESGNENLIHPIRGSKNTPRPLITGTRWILLCNDPAAIICLLMRLLLKHVQLLK